MNQKTPKMKCIDGDSNPGRVESVVTPYAGDEWQRLMIPLHYQCLRGKDDLCSIYIITQKQFGDHVSVVELSLLETQMVRQSTASHEG